MDKTPLGESPAEAAQPLPAGTPAPVTTESAPVETPAERPVDPVEMQKRIDKLTWQRREAERRLEQVLSSVGQQKHEPAESPPVLPTLESVGYDEAKYQAAMASFVKAEARREAEALLSAERQRQETEAKTKTWRQREAEFAAKNPDYQEVAYDPSVPISKAMVEIIAESEVGPAVAYYLAKNPDTAAAIAGLPERAAAREIGRIEARLAAPPLPPPPVSKAPPPPPKIEASPEPEVTRDLSDPKISDAEFKKIRLRQIAQRR